ncbi:hypothetical protein [Moraxella pluranimalium]|uniref:hypothetical protein n=1 Tax=Moraxella pluranimalium TaxID=470453 RepID=UPI001B802B35|nr:hypothetical protein [Moraxella pluranimalium]
MNKAGGIIALIAGIFAVFASLFTLFFGGLDAALNNDTRIVSMGWLGLLFSFLVIVFGAVAMGAKTKKQVLASSPVLSLVAFQVVLLYSFA